MKIETTLFRAIRFWMVTYTAAERDTKRELIKARKYIEATLQPLGEEHGFTMEEGRMPTVKVDVILAPVSLELTRNQIASLAAADQQTPVPSFGKHYDLEEDLIELGDDFKAWVERADAEAEFDRLPESKKKQLAEFAKEQGHDIRS